MSAKFHQNWSL